MSIVSRQLEKTLRLLIAAMPDGAKFYTEAELCGEFRVSRMTANKVLNALAAEGLLLRSRRRGTFVRKVGDEGSALATEERPAGPGQSPAQSEEPPASTEELSALFETSHPAGSIFFLPRRTLRIQVEECCHDLRRRLWERIIDAVESRLPRVKLELVVDPGEAETSDLLVYALYQTNSRHFSRTAEARAVVEAQVARDRHFPVGWTAAERAGIAACPFSLAVGLYVWNRELLTRHCPAFDGLPPERMIDFIERVGDWRAPGLPPLAAFMLYPPAQWLVEGIPCYDERRRRFSFDDPRVLESLAFSRHMAGRARKRCGLDEEWRPATLWKLLLDNRLLAINTYSSSLSLVPPEIRGRYRVQSPMTAAGGMLAIPMYVGIGRRCRQLGAAAEAIDLIGGEVGQTLVAEHCSYVPALRKAAFSSAFIDGMPENMEGVLRQLEGAHSLMDTHPVTTTEEPHYEDFAQYLWGETDLSALMARLKVPRAALQPA